MRIAIAILFALLLPMRAHAAPPDEAAQWRCHGNPNCIADNLHGSQASAFAMMWGTPAPEICAVVPGPICGPGGPSCPPGATSGTRIFYQSYGPPTCSVYSGAYVYQVGRCPVGWLESGGQCTKGICTDQAGKFFDYTGRVTGWSVPGSIDQALANYTAKDHMGALICEDNCTARVTSIACTPVTKSDGSNEMAITCDGTAMYSVTPASCVAEDMPMVSKIGSNKTPGVATVAGAVSGGGKGVTGGATPSDVNLARIATNTARIADAIAGVPGSGSGGGGGGGSTAVTSINEGTTSTSDSIMGSNIAGDTAAATAPGDSSIGALSGVAPTMTPGGGRWLVSVNQFLPTPECSLTAGALTVGTKSVPMSISVCDYAPYARNFLFWAFLVMTAWAIWSAIFASRGS